MSERMKPILGALVTAYVVFYLGITYFYGPILANDAPAEAMMPAWASLAVTSVFLILLYDWVNVSVGNPVRSGLIVGWVLVGVVYGKLSGGASSGAGAQTPGSLGGM